MRKVLLLIIIVLAAAAVITAQTAEAPPPSTQMVTGNSPLLRQTQAEADAKSRGCVSCHQGIEPMHASAAVRLGCTDCHGGDANVAVAAGVTSGDEYNAAKNRAHVLPKFPDFWVRDGRPSSANPERSYTLLNRESPEFIRFINPSDYRIVRESCGTRKHRLHAAPKSPTAVRY